MPLRPDMPIHERIAVLTEALAMVLDRAGCMRFLGTSKSAPSFTSSTHRLAMAAWCSRSRRSRVNWRCCYHERYLLSLWRP